jgi:uncharacterized protein YecT (DUF1311 family)
MIFRLLPALLISLPLVANAAGFDCTKAVSEAEKAVCSNAGLSAQDSTLSATWKQVLAQGDGSAQLKTTQRNWLKQRDACGGDTQCLAQRYRERLDTLNAALGANSDWRQSWALDSDNPSVSSNLTITGTPPNLHFSITAFNGGHDGGLEGDFVLKGEHGTYRNPDGCEIDFHKQGDRVHLEQNGDASACGEPMGVDYDGDYITTARFAKKPSADLLSLKVLGTPAQNAAAHALLGKDYDTLVSTINMRAVGAADVDGLGATVGTYFVRGLADLNAAIVMAHGDSLWVAVLNDGHMRYYTNVLTWKKRVPKTIQTWHDQFDNAPAIDLMP